MTTDPTIIRDGREMTLAEARILDLEDGMGELNHAHITLSARVTALEDGPTRLVELRGIVT